MNLKILCQNIANNPNDFNAEQLEELFKAYANQDKLLMLVFNYGKRYEQTGEEKYMMINAIKDFNNL